jgi:phosphoglycolate phosphatase
MTYRLAIFDYDGTLADSFAWFVDALDESADRFGFRRLDRDQLEAARGLGIDGLMRALDIPAWKIPGVTVHLRQLAKRDRAKIALFPGAAAMLQTLAGRGATLAILTSNAEANVRATLGSELSALFAHWQCGAALAGKGAKLRRLLRDAAIAPERALLIGDEVRDVEAARAAGIKFAAVGWGYAAPEVLRAAGPDVEFANMRDIARYFHAQ